MHSRDIFHPADILLPKGGFEQWSVIACDQFTSQRDYWEEVAAVAGDAVSALQLVLPEVYLKDADVPARTEAINTTMLRYLEQGVLQEYPNALIYVERTQPDGRVRRGIVGAVDLDAYSYEQGATSPIRATEGTVLDRLPPRVRIRKDASIELPHVMLLFDDIERRVITPLAEAAASMPCLYDFELMCGGGHLKGYLIPEAMHEALYAALDTLCEGEHPLLFAVGDGNHSLATAKQCAAQYPTARNGRALVEIVNIHDDALDFEPIYRYVTGADGLLEALTDAAGYEGDDAHAVLCVTDEGERTLSLPPKHALPVGTVDAFLADWLATHPDAEVDYIHGVEDVRQLAQAPGTVGILFDGMGKQDLFPAVVQSGSLPRKTFSMGHARDKRYYTEARRIR